MTLWGRPDLSTFEVGSLYRHDFSDEIVEFIGVASGMEELPGEDVGVFRSVPDGWCLIATQRSYNRGETFTPAGDAVADELDEP